MLAKLTPHFGKHLLVTDVFVFFALLIYNLCSWGLPINRIRLGSAILFMVIIDGCLTVLKLVNNFNFGANRQV